MEKVLFWDFDGTLIHANESFLDALQFALEDYKHDIAIEEIRHFLHTVCSWNIPTISYVGRTGLKWWHSLFKHFDDFFENHKIAKADMEKIKKIFKNRILDFRSYTLYADAEEVLCKCNEMGYKNYILSNNFPELPLVIKDLQLSKYFTDYIVSSNVGYEKPRAEIFQYALSIANFPDYFYMIGDNPIADIQGGRSVGMKTILVHRQGYFDTDYHCESLPEIPLLLDR